MEALMLLRQMISARYEESHYYGSTPRSDAFAIVLKDIDTLISPEIYLPIRNKVGFLPPEIKKGDKQ